MKMDCHGEAFQGQSGHARREQARDEQTAQPLSGERKPVSVWITTTPYQVNGENQRQKNGSPQCQMEKQNPANIGLCYRSAIGSRLTNGPNCGM